MKGSQRTRRLGQIADLNPRLTESLEGDTPVSFVPMSAVTAETASTTPGEERRYSEVSKGFTSFFSGDLLVAKITPCFENGKIAQATLAHRLGFGSTEFHVIRPRPGVSDARYLLHFLRQDRIRRAGERKMTGSAGQRRVPEHFLAGLDIPLPQLTEQRRIAEVLDHAEALRARRRAALAELDTLVRAVFLDMFGNPSTNPKAWPIRTIADVAEQVTDGEHLTPKRSTDGIKLLSARNIRDGYIDFENVDYIGVDEYERIRRRCDPTLGDVLISCSGTIGRVASVETQERFSLVRSAALVRPKSSLVGSKFLEHYLRTPPPQIPHAQASQRVQPSELVSGPDS